MGLGLLLANANEGTTPALGDSQARWRLDASAEGTLSPAHPKPPHTGKLERPLDPASVYRNVVRHYALAAGISREVSGLCVHSLRATAPTNALSHQADIAKV